MWEIGLLSAGALAGVLVWIIASRTIARRHKGRVSDLIRRHFHPVPLESLTISERGFPFRVRPDMQRAVESAVATGVSVSLFCGLRDEAGRNQIAFSGLITDQHYLVHCAPPEYEEVDIGEDEPVRCLKNALWLLDRGSSRHAVLLTQTVEYGPCGLIRHLVFQVATVNDPEGLRFAQEFFDHLEKGVVAAASYRGKVLSLEGGDRYSGQGVGITVHKLRKVERNQVILPAETLDLLDRNVLRFVARRSKLHDFGLATKKGILFYGPPGTGKTHTVHYLAGALLGHTTLLITAEQVGSLAEYMALARLLQPSVVVVEDVDLIARERTEMDVQRMVLLHKLLNEMDGLREDAEILFILTTNRPELLEAALASRPGRIDQAIEFPLPGEDGREKLVRLYSYGIDVPEDVLQIIVNKTEGVSGAFIKELMRRSIQFHLERSDSRRVEPEDINGAMEELLFRGGSLNLKLLGADVDRSHPKQE